MEIEFNYIFKGLLFQIFKPLIEFKLSFSKQIVQLHFAASIASAGWFLEYRWQFAIIVWN